MLCKTNSMIIWVPTDRYVGITGICPALLGKTPGVPERESSCISVLPTLYLLQADISCSRFDFTSWGGSFQHLKPSAVFCREDHNQVFAIGLNDSALHSRRYNNGWEAWQKHGGLGVSTPEAASWGTDRVDVFVIGTDSGLWQISSTDGGGNWNSWSGKGGKWIAAPEVTSWGRDRYDVFLLGTDSRLFHSRYNGSWSEFFDLGGTIIKPPTAVSWSKNRLDVFVIGTNGAMYHKWSSGNGSWGPSQFGYEDLRGISITAVG
jgi:hypothetical protein